MKQYAPQPVGPQGAGGYIYIYIPYPFWLKFKRLRTFFATVGLSAFSRLVTILNVGHRSDTVAWHGAKQEGTTLGEQGVPRGSAHFAKPQIGKRKRYVAIVVPRRRSLRP